MKDRTLTDNLKQTIKTLASQGKALHNQIIDLRGQPDTGKAREKLWMNKRGLGKTTRCHLLAYAYLRGVPYKTVETKAIVGNIPYAGDIAELTVADASKTTREQMAAQRKLVKDWLDTKVPAVPASDTVSEPNLSTTEAA